MFAHIIGVLNSVDDPFLKLYACSKKIHTLQTLGIFLTGVFALGVVVRLLSIGTGFCLCSLRFCNQACTKSVCVCELAEKTTEKSSPGIYRVLRQIYFVAIVFAIPMTKFKN